MESRAADDARWYVTDHGLVERASMKSLILNDIENPDRFKRTLREAMRDAVERTNNKETT